MKNYRFVMFEDIVRWFLDGAVTEISFTDDRIEDVDEKFEPTGWYGMKIIEVFDREQIVFGKWGGGIEKIEEANYDITEAIKEFFEWEFGRKLSLDTKICCEAEGLPLVELFRRDDGSYNVYVNGDLAFTNITKDIVDVVKWALEKGIEYGKELGE